MSIDVSLVAKRLLYDAITVWLYDAAPSKMVTENV
jgi:hypothetical protein